MFTLTQILVSTVVGSIASLVVLWLYSRSAKDARLLPVDVALAAIVVGISAAVHISAVVGATPSTTRDPGPRATR